MDGFLWPFLLPTTFTCLNPLAIDQAVVVSQPVGQRNFNIYVTAFTGAFNLALGQPNVIAITHKQNGFLGLPHDVAADSKHFWFRARERLGFLPGHVVLLTNYAPATQ